ncbi:MAG: sulfur carrier protein ThiS adenylyltransferase ThiF [Dictyoglomaceae bacterium]
MTDFHNMLLKYFSEDDLRKIENIKVVIVGCGGLGSNAAITLARTGFSNFILVDFDKVELSNLNRQFYFFHQIGMPKVLALKENILLINKNCNIITYQVKINEENARNILSQGDIIFEGVDKAEVKILLLETALSLGKKIVMASGVCGYGDSENIIIKRLKNLSVIGDFVSDNTRFRPLAPKVIAVSSMQCDELLRMVLIDEK